jgi:hypothetical protein
MTNPFKKVAYALFLRGGLYLILGLFSIVAVIPAIMNIELSIDIAGGIIGLFLLGLGIRDIVAALQRITPLRLDRLAVHDIDKLYLGGREIGGLPLNLMNADANPNEQDPRNPGEERDEWTSRVYPRFAFLPQPYKTVFQVALVALGLGITGVLLMLFLRVIVARSSPDVNLSALLDWYRWSTILIGYGFWFSISWFGFRNVFQYERPFRSLTTITPFIILLIVAAIASFGVSKTGSGIALPPSLGILPTLMWVGSLLTIAACVAFVYLRSKRAPNEYRVYRTEEFFTVSMHPTDIVNCVKSFVSRVGGGRYSYLGNWKPNFEERSAVSAGEFHADLHAESAIQLDEAGSKTFEASIGTLLAIIGVGLSAIGGFLLWNSNVAEWNGVYSITFALREPIALFVFGAVIYRLGNIAVAEMRWTSVATYTHLDGTFQTQGGMALMQAGDHSVKGSVLSSANVQPKCAYITSVGYLDPGRAKNKLVRIIDGVEPAEPIANEMLAFIKNQAINMMNAGAPVASPDVPQIEVAIDSAPVDNQE